ncbi:MAG TPA: glycosyltransferase [Caldimonas sp.]|jgi:glycosyltransferase involved in cell wall biosynthesis|nr:glycosyltransferase [Caldimonas sp.]HEX2542198.1 glycosyltransferase [Caldimonas sp.]
MIPAYNPSPLLHDTLDSIQAAMLRAAGPFEVQIIDDASPHSDVAAYVARSDMEVGYFRREENGGLGAAWNTCISRASGRLVHILHQDDLVRPDFYAQMESLEAACPEAGMLFCRAGTRSGDEVKLTQAEQPHAGFLRNWLDTLVRGQRVYCPAVVVRKSVYEAVGGFDPALKFLIDWEMWVRIAAHGPVAYCPEVLAEYRVHGESETARLRASAGITRDAAATLVRIRRTLDSAGRGELADHALRFVVWLSSDACRKALGERDSRTARDEALHALKSWGLRMRPWELARTVRHLAHAMRS